MRVRCAGFVWYDESDYPRILEVMKDAHVLPRTFMSWLQKAEQGLRHFETTGGVAVKAYLKPDAFLDWCATLNIEPDSKARVRFANEEALRVAMKLQRQ